MDGLTRTVSWTTRQQRAGELDGVDYAFVNADRFQQQVGRNGFLEWAEVHGNFYGTPRSEIQRIHAADHDAVMVIDVQGADSVREAVDEAVTIFILPPSRDVLWQRLHARDHADARASEQIRRRLDVAAHEISRYVSYDYVVINDELEVAVADLVGIVRAERARRERRATQAEAIRSSFSETAGTDTVPGGTILETNS
jgi:guanylate kinase